MKKYITPRLKPIVEICSIGNKIYFFNRPGVAIEMKDDTKFIASTCKLMDGIKNVQVLKEDIAVLHPNEAPYVDQLLTVLDNEYLLEDTTINQISNLSLYDKERWSKNIEFFGAHCKATDNKYAYQEKLKSTKIAIFGLGGVGSNILYNLVAMGVTHIKAIDYDQVELSNLNRQIIYNDCDINTPKSVAAKKRILEFLPNINIEFVNKKISSACDIEELIIGYDLVITAIDQPREKIIDWFNLACVTQKIPFICGSIDSRIAMYYTICPGKTGCVDCWKNNAKKSKYLFQNLIQKNGFIASSMANIAIMPYISVVTGLMANEILKLITFYTNPQSLGKLCVYDFISCQHEISEEWDINPDCPTCRKD